MSGSWTGTACRWGTSCARATTAACARPRCRFVCQAPFRECFLLSLFCMCLFVCVCFKKVQLNVIITYIYNHNRACSKAEVGLWTLFCGTSTAMQARMTSKRLPPKSGHCSLWDIRVLATCTSWGTRVNAMLLLCVFIFSWLCCVAVEEVVLL